MPGQHLERAFARIVQAGSFGRCLKWDFRRVPLHSSWPRSLKPMVRIQSSKSEIVRSQLEPSKQKIQTFVSGIATQALRSRHPRPPQDQKSKAPPRPHLQTLVVYPHSILLRDMCVGLPPVLRQLDPGKPSRKKVTGATTQTPRYSQKCP